MKRGRNYIWTALGVSALLVAISGTGAGRSMAQTAAAEALTLIRDVDNPARHPFQISMPVNVYGCVQRCFTQTTLFTVPAGKRLVVQQVLVVGYGYQNRSHYGQFFAMSGNNFAEPAISFAPQGVFNNSEVVTGSVAGPLYADAGAQLQIDLFDQDNTTGEGTLYQATVTGYYISL